MPTATSLRLASPPRSCRDRSCGVVLGLALLLGPTVAAAWTPAAQEAIAERAASLAPADLGRQIVRHRPELRRGTLAAFRQSAKRHVADDRSGTLAATAIDEIRRAVGMIRSHRPFADVVFQLGIVSHYLADANDPLAVSAADPDEGEYFVDYSRYEESAMPRFAVVFYGLEPEVDAGGGPAWIVRRAIARGRRLYPFIGWEYERIGGPPASGRFDDRSTAFGVAAVSFSHAVSDAAVAYRFIWLAAGGADPRATLPRRGGPLLLLPDMAR